MQKSREILEKKYLVIGNIICTLDIFCFVFKPADHLKTQEFSQTFIPYLQNISSMFGPSQSSKKGVGVGSSAPGRLTDLSIHTQAKCRVQLPKDKVSVTTEGPGLGRSAQPHRQLQEGLDLLQTLHHACQPLQMSLVPRTISRVYI